MDINTLWNTFFFDPMLNGLIWLSSVLLGSFGLTIVVFTIAVRTVMLPLTLRQLYASKSMAQLQPRIQDLQKKYGKDRQMLSQETMKLYKEFGVNPLGCAVPTVIQFPIWIGLYQSILFALGDKPENLLALAQHLYPQFPAVQHAIPIEKFFLWLNLAHPDKLYILPVLVGGTMWLQQKMMTMPSADAQQAQMNRMMQTMMPLMFAFFTISFPSGLALYWVASNLYSIVTQYFVTGWGSLLPAPAATVAAPAKKTKPKRKK